MRRFRFAYLLASLLLVAFLRPFIAERVVGVAIVDILLFVTLIAGAFAAIERRRQFLVVAALATVSAGSGIVWHVTSQDLSAAVFLVVTLGFYASITWILLRRLFTGEKITRDTLCQAFSVYLLLGVAWALAYALLELVSPGSFTFSGGALDDSRFDRFIGFSFVTLTTLGYGNISPETPRADAIATLQAVVGQAYLAVVIARLVAIQIAEHRDTRHRTRD
ncbi:MAG: potassium channel family protein [Phycisphaerales bacterium]